MKKKLTAILAAVMVLALNLSAFAAPSVTTVTADKTGATQTAGALADGVSVKTSGIVINGQLVYGCDGNAGELGHVTMVRGENGRTCGCGRKGCLEAYCSATGVARTAREMLQKTDRPSILRDLEPDKITSLDVSIAAGKGDELAKEIYDFTGTMLGEACADFAAFSSPEAFIFFGGMAKAGDLLMDPIKKSYDEHVMKIFKGKAKFLFSSLDGGSAAVLGASAIGWDL